MHIHLIGAGKMGLPMGRHLVGAGHVVTVDDPDAGRMSQAAALGMVNPSANLGMAQAEIVLSSLPNDHVLWQVATLVGDHARPGAIFIDTSTVSPTMSARVADLMSSRGIEYMRVTVSGNNMMAEEAALTLLVSGPRATFDRLMPVLRLFGPSQFWLGEGEEARLMKLVVNLMIAQTSAMLAESLTLGSKGGLAWKDMWDVLTHSAVASPIIKAKATQLVQRDFTPTFTVAQMTKDVKLILEEAERLSVALPQTALTLQALHAATAHGDGGADYAAIIRCSERAAALSSPV